MVLRARKQQQGTQCKVGGSDSLTLQITSLSAKYHGNNNNLYIYSFYDKYSKEKEINILAIVHVREKFSSFCDPVKPLKIAQNLG